MNAALAQQHLKCVLDYVIPNLGLPTTELSVAVSPAIGDGVRLSLMYIPDDVETNGARVDVWIGPSKPPRVIFVMTERPQNVEDCSSTHLCYHHAQAILDSPLLALALHAVGSCTELQMLPEVEQQRTATIEELIESSRKYGRAR